MYNSEKPTESQVFAHLAKILRNFEGREYSGTISRDTLMFNELGMTSIDAVILKELLEAQYQVEIPFSELVADLAERGAEDIHVGELSQFVSDSLRRAQ